MSNIDCGDGCTILNTQVICLIWMDATVCKLPLSRVVTDNRGNWVWGLREFCVLSSPLLSNPRSLRVK